VTRPPLSSSLLAIVALSVLTSACPASGAEVRYVATEIGNVARVPAWGQVINGAGDVGGWVELPNTDGTTTTRPILSHGGTSENLGLVSDSIGGYVTGLNDRGQAAIGYDFPGGRARPYLYTGRGAPQPIALPAGFISGSPSAINNLGQVAGTVSSVAGGSGARPFVYADGVMSVLPLPADAERGFGQAINDRGDVLVDFLIPNGSRFTERPAVWSGGTLTQLATPAGFTHVRPVDINNLGHVLGWAELLRADGNTVSRKPVIYRDGVATVLESFGTADPPNGFNDRDEIVGSGLSLKGYGLLYADGTRTDLSALVPLPDGFSITQGLDINNAGQILARARNAVGDTRTYVLTPVPEPGAAGLALAAGALRLLRRRRALSSSTTTTRAASREVR
jgi:uncharacterized membrane protein